MDPVWALRQIAFQLGRAVAPTYRVRAFRRRPQWPMACQPPAYLTKLLGDARPSEPTSIRAVLRGDCHTHSDWSEWADYVTA